MNPTTKIQPQPLISLPGGRLNGWPFRRTMLVAGVVAVAATFLSFFLSPRLGLVVALALAAVGLLLRKGPAILLTLVAAVCILSTACHHQFRATPLEKMAGQRVTLSGQVTDWSSSGATVIVTVTDSPQLPRGTRLAVYCPEGSLALFDVTTLEVDLKPLPATSGTWRRQGIFLYALPTALTREEGYSYTEGKAPLSLTLQPVRYHLQEVLRTHLPGPQGDWLSALCLGLKSDLSPAVNEAFRGSGLSHLLVVSGLHLSALAWAVMMLLRRLLDLRPAAGVTALVVLLFMWMMNDTPSVNRAGVLCLVWLGGYFCRRQPDALNSLGLALLILLPVNPYFLWDAGFQLSFCATAGVLLWAGRMPAPPTPEREQPRHKILWHRWRYRLLEAVYVFIGANVAILPLICYYFGGFPVTGLVANLLAVTPTGAALLIGWLGILLCTVPFLAWLGQPLLLAAAKLMDYVVWVAKVCSPDWAFVPVNRPWSFLPVTGVCLLMICAVGFRIPRRRWMPAVGCLVLTSLLLGIPLSLLQ